MSSLSRISGRTETIAISLIGLNAEKSKIAYDLAGTYEDLDVCLDTVVYEKAEYLRYGMEIGCHAIPNKYLLHLGGAASGGAYRWFKEELGQTEVAESKRLKINPYSIMDDEAEKINAGSDGVFFQLPHYYKGNKMSISGLNLSHSRGHMIRAIMENSAFEFYKNIEILSDLGISVEEVVIAGGCSKSRVWRQIKADVLGLPVHLMDVEEPGTLGAAILAGVGVKIYEDPIKIGKEFVEIKDTCNPKEDVHTEYLKIYEAHRSAF